MVVRLGRFVFTITASAVMIPVQNSNGNFCTINSHEHSSEIDAFFNCNNKRERQKCILVRQFSFEINDDDQKKKNFS